MLRENHYKKNHCVSTTQHSETSGYFKIKKAYIVIRKMKSVAYRHVINLDRILA